MIFWSFDWHNFVRMTELEIVKNKKKCLTNWITVCEDLKIIRFYDIIICSQINNLIKFLIIDFVQLAKCSILVFFAHEKYHMRKLFWEFLKLIHNIFKMWFISKKKFSFFFHQFQSNNVITFWYFKIWLLFAMLNSFICENFIIFTSASWIMIFWTWSSSFNFAAAHHEHDILNVIFIIHFNVRMIIMFCKFMIFDEIFNTSFSKFFNI